MKNFPLSVILLWMINIATGQLQWEETRSIGAEIIKLNASCPYHDSCREPRSTESLTSFNCHCGTMCLQFDTCCLDSPNIFVKPPKLKQNCRSIDDINWYFMVDRCPTSDDTDPVWESLCEEEWNGEDDVMKLVPVTSQFTHITYKNYFCFRCHERTDEFLYWNVMMSSNDYEFDETIDRSKVYPRYDRYYQTWMAPLGHGGSLIPVELKMQIPQDVYRLVVGCEQKVMSRCSDMWVDKDVRDKCEAYMAVMVIKRDDYEFKYRNVFCAICNFEDVSNLTCRERYGGYGGKVPFSFTHLLDINTSSGDQVGKIQKCERGFLWDPFSKTCKKLVCALPGYVIKNGKCAPP